MAGGLRPPNRPAEGRPANLHLRCDRLLLSRPQCRGPDRGQTDSGERDVQTSTAVDTSLSFPRGITRYQWLVFFVVWAGWTLDAADFGLYSLVLQPALKDLMVNPTPA